MSDAVKVLLGALVALTVVYIVRWYLLAERGTEPGPRTPNLKCTLLGFVTNFFDTLGVGSFAPTTSAFKLFKLVDDERIPGTLNAGHALPTITQALIFITVVEVDPTTLITMIVASMLGAWL